MRKILVGCFLPLLLLSACNYSNNTIKIAELTDREDAILAISSDTSFIFDFEVDDSYEQVVIRIEKYTDGEFVEVVSESGGTIYDSGSIIFTTTDAVTDNGDPLLRQINVGISSNDGHTNVRNSHDISDDQMEDYGTLWGQLFEDSKEIDGEMVLAYLAHSSANPVSTLSVDFYDNPTANMDELNQYEIAYLIKAEFK